MAIETIILIEMRLTDNSVIPPVINPIRFTNAPFDVSDNSGSVIYQATGDLLGVGDFENTYELITDGLELTLSGVNPVYQSLIETKGFESAPIDIWLAQLNPESNTVATKVY